MYRGCHFPPEIISCAVWLYSRYALSFRDVEELLAHRGITVSYEAIRRWCIRFGPLFAQRLRCQAPRQGDVWLLDEVFLAIGGQRYYLWRAIDQDGDMIDVLLQKRRNGTAAKRFFRKLLKGERVVPNQLVTDKLGSYRVAHRDLMPTAPHDTTQYSNNRCEASHRTTREKERHMKRFRRAATAQRFLALHGRIANLMNWSRHRISANLYRHFREQAFATWSAATCA